MDLRAAAFNAGAPFFGSTIRPWREECSHGLVLWHKKFRDTACMAA